MLHGAAGCRTSRHFVPATLDARFLCALRPRLIGDRGYDSDLLDAQLPDQYGIEMIAPNRARRGHARRPPVAALSMSWKVKRLFAWLHHSPQLVTRWEYHAENFLGLLQLAYAHILLRAFMRQLQHQYLLHTVIVCACSTFER